MGSDITPLLLTFNEAPNLLRTLRQLVWAKAIIIVDSFSTDETLAIARQFPQVRVVQRKFDTHAQQWSFGIEQVGTPWVLALDADYFLPSSFADELRNLRLGEDFSAYYARFRYCVFGRPLRGTLYPPRAVLFRKDRCHYIQDGHTQRLRIEGQTGWLRGQIDHDDRKGLSQWFCAQNRYAQLETGKLTAALPSGLSLQDRLRRHVVVAPPLVFFYTLLVKGLILDGWPGWFYVFQRTLAELLLSLKLLEARLTMSAVERDRSL